MPRVQPGGLEAYPGIGAGDENRLAGEINVCWDVWDAGCELFETEGEWSVRIEAEGVLVGEAEREGRQEQHG